MPRLLSVGLKISPIVPAPTLSTHELPVIIVWSADTLSNELVVFTYTLQNTGANDSPNVL